VYSLRVAVRIVDHPLVQDILLSLRDVKTEPEGFRRMAVRISVLLAAEALRSLPVRPATVQSPLGEASGHRVATDVVVVPVLRAGLGMLDAVLELVPGARVGHIGLQRDEMTAVAMRYYAKLPPGLENSHVLMIDPMLATGGSAIEAVDLLKEKGARRIQILCIVAAPEGIALVERHHPDVDIFTPVIDTCLNERKFIVPGLGDFGDRLYGTL
jgi:uracil phosphoribosyltransferase